MKTRMMLVVGAGVAAINCTTATQAQERDLENKNRFSLGARMHFNISADLTSVPGGLAGGPDYDDGFVRTDISGNAGGKTWNWGYSATNQVFGTSPGQQLELHGAPSPRDGLTEELTRNLQYGFEIGYGRELLNFGDPKKPFVLGVEASFGSSALSLTATRDITGPVARKVDRYAFGSVVPPVAPYVGTFEGPIPANPSMPLLATNIVSSTISTETATSSQRADIDGTYWGFRLGPFFETPMMGRFSFQLGGGLAAIHADARLRYRELFAITGVGGPPAGREDSQPHNEWLLGFYGEAKVNYWINDAMGIYLGGQYQSLEDFTLTARNRTAVVKFGEAIAVTVGVTYEF